MHNLLLKFVLSLLVVSSTSAPYAFANDDPTADTVLTDAAEQLEQIDNMQFIMEIEGTTYVDPTNTIRLVGAEGVMQRPDRVDVTFTAVFLGAQQISIRMITVGEEAWITDIVTGKWVTAPPEFGYNPAVLYDEELGLGPVMSRMNDPELNGTEEIDGRDAWHITATVDGEILRAMTSGTMRGSEQRLELWIDTETNDILQIRIHEPENEDLDDPATWTLILSDHNEDVNIESPVE